MATTQTVSYPSTILYIEDIIDLVRDHHNDFYIQCIIVLRTWKYYAIKRMDTINLLLAYRLLMITDRNGDWSIRCTNDMYHTVFIRGSNNGGTTIVIYRSGGYSRNRRNPIIMNGNAPIAYYDNSHPICCTAEELLSSSYTDGDTIDDYGSYMDKLDSYLGSGTPDFLMKNEVTDLVNTILDRMNRYGPMVERLLHITEYGISGMRRDMVNKLSPQEQQSYRRRLAMTMLNPTSYVPDNYDRSTTIIKDIIVTLFYIKMYQTIRLIFKEIPPRVCVHHHRTRMHRHMLENRERGDMDIISLSLGTTV
jgi:hypothetical protein